MAAISGFLPVAARLTASQVLLFGPRLSLDGERRKITPTREGKEIGRWLARI